MILAALRDLNSAALLLSQLFVGLFLIGFCGGLALLIPVHPASLGGFFWLVLVVSVNDSAAFFIGSRVQGPRLAPILSPNKTVSGAAAGLACGAVVGTLFFSLLSVEASTFVAFIFSALVCAAAQIADLAKSFVKRLNGVKDTGHILPGHGGVLDRIDGILGGAPFVYFGLVYSFVN